MKRYLQDQPRRKIISKLKSQSMLNLKRGVYWSHLKTNKKKKRTKKIRRVKGAKIDFLRPIQVSIVHHLKKTTHNSIRVTSKQIRGKIFYVSVMTLCII